jgi:hypothetical protein
MSVIFDFCKPLLLGMHLSIVQLIHCPKLFVHATVFRSESRTQRSDTCYRVMLERIAKQIKQTNTRYIVVRTNISVI